jgi:PQQ-like domain
MSGPRRFRSRIRVVLALLPTASASACGASDRSVGTPPPGAERTIVEAEWRPAWVRGGSETDTLMLLPVELAVDGGLVYVADRMGRRVVAFRSADGAHAWSAGREGAGPGELRHPSAIAAIPGQGVVVADMGNARLSFLDRAGALRRELPLPDATIVTSICALYDGSLLLARLGHGDALLRMGAEGEVAERRELPWPDLDDGPILRRQALLAPTRGGDGCILALGLGRGFARYDGRAFTATHPYVEALEVPDPEVRMTKAGQSERLPSPRFAATSLSVDSGVVAIGFGGETPDAGWLVDHYDEATGAYLFSYRAPVPLERVARAGSRYYVLTRLEGYPALVAFEVREKREAR